MAVDSFARTLAIKALQGGGGSGGSGQDGVGVISSSVSYALSDGGTTTPSGPWSSTIPAVSQGKYLWTKVVINYSDGNDTTFYSVAYAGKDGKDGEDGADAPVISSVETEEVTNADGYTTNSLNLVLSDGTKLPFDVKVKEGEGGSGDGGVFVPVSGFGVRYSITQENYDILVSSENNGLKRFNNYYRLAYIDTSSNTRVYSAVEYSESSGASLQYFTIASDLTVTYKSISVLSDTYTAITSPVSDDVYNELKANSNSQVSYNGGNYKRFKSGSTAVTTLYFQGGVMDSNSLEWVPQTLIIDGTTKEITVVPNTSGKIEFIGGMLPEAFEVGKTITVPRTWLHSITEGRTNIYQGELVLSKYNYLLIADSTQPVRPNFGSQVKLRMLKSFVPNTKEVQIPISDVVQDATTGLWSAKIKDVDIEPNVYVRIYPADEVTTRILSSTLVSTICGYYIDTPATSDADAIYGVEIALTKQPYNTLSFYYELRGVTPNGN